MPGFDANRPWRHLYGRRWDRLRLRFLDKNPLCKHCLELGEVTPATVVDHIKAHKGDEALFWDKSNWQPLCPACHDGWKRSLEAAEAKAIGVRPNAPLYVLVGPSGAGKSRWAAEFARAEAALWLSLDKIRGEKKWVRTDHDKAEVELIRALRGAAKTTPVLVDSTALGYRWRRDLRSEAKAQGRPANVVLVNQPLNVLLARNMVRSEPRPVDMVSSMYNDAKDAKRAVALEPWSSEGEAVWKDGRAVYSVYKSRNEMGAIIGCDNDGYPINGSW
jgi:5-methylcytosine-specific restriction protein A